MNSPVIVVGMPRSGSTLLTRILNESSELFIVNDFYYLQYVDSVNGFIHTDHDMSKVLAEEIFNKIKARIERKDSPELECGLFFSEEAEHKLENFIHKIMDKENYTWSELLEKIMSYSSSLLDKRIWGYNTPQDYLYIDRLEQHFPDSKFIYMIRDPRSVLRSYKNVQSDGYHEANRYHPILQGLAWRTSIRSFIKNSIHENYLLIRYEDLVSDCNTELSRISKFLSISFPKIDINQFGNNSSFKDKNRALDLTNTEIWLCELIAKKEMKKINYSLSESRPKIGDTIQITKLTLKVANFYLSKLLLSSDIRKRVLNFAQKI